MELFGELRWLLIIVVSVSLYFPLNVPLAALAYRVQRGTRPLDLETQELWVRSAFAALGLTVMSWVVLFADYFIVHLEFPPDVVHLVFLGLLIPAGVWYFFWIFGFDEVMEGFNAFMLYLGIPSLLLAFFLFIGFQFPLMVAEGFLLERSPL